MMRFFVLVLVVFGAAAVFSNTLRAQWGDFSSITINQPVVIELFTSQSCSSCPPADRVLSHVAQDSNVIALGYHVTYWNHLHWKDTLSQQFATDRQRDYARFKKSRRVYTPQMIVNGGAEFTGSNAGKLQRALNNAQPVAPITVTKTDTHLEIDLPAIDQDRYTLWVYGVQSAHTQSIKAGENRGRTVDYAHAVLSQTDAGQWDGSAQTVSLAYTMGPDEDRVIVLAQKRGYGSIGAAGQMTF